jgi:uncharacterized protein YndB with AHSA1/START domain
MPVASTAAKPSLILKRRINASPARVYAAWTDPGQIARWWGPEGAVVVHAETDLRVGGRFRKITRTPDGEEHEVSGIYREVVPDEKLVFTWAWRTTPERESLVTVLLKEERGGTWLTLIHEQFLNEAARDRHRLGWSGALDSLERLLV